MRIISAFLALGFAAALPARAAEHALVVGINDYEHFSAPAEARRTGQRISDLLGAENDARLIADALRDGGVNLPGSRLLLGRRATLAAFLDAWQDLISTAQPGDTLIVTFAGHGGQEREPPGETDEADGLDETIMFADFDPANPREGRLNDDQLHALLSDANRFNIVWVMDSCHSGGLNRSVDARMTGLSRNGGLWDIAIAPLIDEIPASDDEGAAPQAHVTRVLATAADHRVVTETTFDGKPHGALSYFFAEAYRGAADSNADNLLERRELDAYLNTQILSHMNQNQQPRLLPVADDTVAIALRGQARPVSDIPEPDIEPQTVRVRVIGGGLLPELGPSAQMVEFAADVSFESKANGWEVYNHTGDSITRLSGSDPQDIVRVIAGIHLLKQLPRLLRADLPMGEISPAQPTVLQKIGTTVGFRFVPPTPDLAYLIIFNLTGSGTLQYLYPSDTGAERVGAAGIDLNFKVTPPAGADQLVALYCGAQPAGLKDFLRQHDQQGAPEPSAFTQHFMAAGCQIARTGLFTSP